jgi:nucleotide-binding universal stress UspA family protein
MRAHAVTRMLRALTTLCARARRVHHHSQQPGAAMSFQPKRILVPIDFSASARAAADAAVDIAKAFGGRIQLLHVLPLGMYVEYVSGLDGSGVNAAALQEALRAQVAKEGKAELARISAAGIPVELQAVDGPPPAEICIFAEQWKADVIVIGSHGRTGIKRVLLGSVAESVVRHAVAPVLTIRAAHAT